MEFSSYASNKIYELAIKYGIKAKAISYKDSLIELEYKGKKELIKQTATKFTNIIQGRICDNKYLALKRLKANGINNIPKNIMLNKVEKEKDLEIMTTYPVVVKPLKGHGGVGVSVNINNFIDLKNAFDRAKKEDESVIIEEYIEGEDYRFLVVNDKVFVAKRTPAAVVGNGKNTIKELIENENQKRINNNLLTQIKVDDEVKRILTKQGYSLIDIGEKGKTIFLRKNANLSTGGTVIDYTEIVHKKNQELALKVAKIMNMKIIAIDFLFKDPSIPYDKNNGIIIEINDTPGIRINHPREEEIVIEVFKLLFPILIL